MHCLCNFQMQVMELQAALQEASTHSGGQQQEQQQQACSSCAVLQMQMQEAEGQVGGLLYACPSSQNVAIRFFSLQL